MRWLADEHIPGHAIAYLRQQGEDVLSIAEATLDGQFTVITPEGTRQRPLRIAS